MSRRDASSGTRPGRGGGTRARDGRRLAAAVLLLATGGLAALSGVADRTGAASRRMPYATAFPQGPGKAIAERACLLCHSVVLVTQQAKDSTGWEKSIIQMEKWGAPLTLAEHDTLRAYLLARFGPRSGAR